MGKGAFADGGASKTIEGLACEIIVDKPGLPDKHKARVKIWGLPYADMAELTMLTFKPQESYHNLMSIKAGEQGGALALLFEGEIMSASADFNQSPDPCMDFAAESGDYAQQIASPLVTVKGELAADRLFARFAAEAGYRYRNEGVEASVLNACFSGSPLDKMHKLAREVGCELIIDDGEALVLPAGQARQGEAVLLNRASGLIGYPTFTQDGISCRCLFNPNLLYAGLIEVQSQVPRASGTWRITRLSHMLSAYTPGGGMWESRVEAQFME